MAPAQTLLTRYLNEALATERTLITTLQAHIAMTPAGPYRRLLERHLRETQRHALALSERLESSTSLAGVAIGLAGTLAGQVIALAKGPFDLLRGDSLEEKLLKNAKDECATEALEIATYDAIEALAEAVGDIETADLARSHRADEERMLAGLRALIPSLAGVTAERALALTATEPWHGYDEAGTAEILARLDEASAGSVRDYESRHRRRVSILEAAQRELSRQR